MRDNQLAVMKNKVVKRRSRYLYVSNNKLFAQIGNDLCTSDDYGISWQNYPVTLDNVARAYSKMHARLFRKGVHSIITFQDGKILLLAKGAIYTCESGQNNLNKPFSIPRGSRPLFICENKDGELFWGEYFSNSKKEEVNIYASKDDGQSWQVVYKFKKDSIRHVHGVFCDPYDNRIWVTTGDEDHESALWVTKDGFKTLEKIIGGNQQSRALQLIFTKDYVYFGTDTPYETNHIYRINKNTEKIEELASVDSSVYWGCKVNDCLFFSTAVEPSRINESAFASIWGSCDGRHWQRIVRYRKDFWPLKYGQPGQIYFPQGNNSTGYLFYTPVATECDQTLQRLKVSNIF